MITSRFDIWMPVWRAAYLLSLRPLEESDRIAVKQAARPLFMSRTMSFSPDQPDAPQSFSEETVRRVLMRASELDAARTAELSLADLRHVAQQAGITPSALDQALAEPQSHSLDNIAAKPTPEVPAWYRRHPVALGALLTFGIIASAMFVVLVSRIQ